MNATAVIIIAIAAAVVLGAARLLHPRPSHRRARRRRAAAPRPSSVIARPRRPRPSTRVASAAAERVEAEGVAARVGTGLAPVETDTGLTPWVPPDPEALGVSRRQFFNRATISLMGAGIGTFSAAAFVAFLWPTKTGGFGGKVPVGQTRRHQGGIKHRAAASSTPPRPRLDHRVPVRRAPEGRGGLPSSLLPGIDAGHHRSATRSARTSAAASRSACRASGSSAGATVRSTTASARRRAARPRAAWTTSRSTISAAGDVTVDTGTIVPGPAIGTNTTGQEAEGPHCVGAAEH